MHSRSDQATNYISPHGNGPHGNSFNGNYANRGPPFRDVSNAIEHATPRGHDHGGTPSLHHGQHDHHGQGQQGHTARASSPSGMLPPDGATHMVRPFTHMAVDSSCTMFSCSP